MADTNGRVSRTEYRRSDEGGGYGRRLLLAFCSMLVPGTGQVAAGARRRGYIMIGLVLVLLAGGIAIAVQGVDAVVAFVIQPRVLLALLGVNVALLAFRLYATVDAYLAAGRRPTPKGATEHVPRPDQEPGAEPTRTAASSGWRMALAGLGLAIVLLLAIVPHGVLGYYTLLSHDLLTTVFVSEEETTTSTLSPSTTVTTSHATTTTTTRILSTSSTATTSSTTTTTVPALDLGDDSRLTVLLVGTDAGYGRKGARADTIMVATVDLDTGAVALFGIPRNTGSVALSDRVAEALGTDVYVNLISDLYADAAEHPDLASGGGDAGAEVLRETVSDIMGIPIDYYAVVDLNGFIDLVDAFDGVTVNVKERIYVRMASITKGEKARVYDIRPGVQHLDGHEALAFARSRTGSNDYERMQRQRCVLLALLYQNGVADLALKFPGIAGAIKNNLKTDIPIDRLADLIRIRGKIQIDEMIAVGFTPPEYTAGRNKLGYNILDLDLVRATVRQVIDGPEEWRASVPGDGSPAKESPSDCWRVKR